MAASKQGSQRSLARRVLRVILIVLACVAGALCLLLAFLTVTEYRPEDEEDVAIEQADASGEDAKATHVGDSLTYMTWNVGYGALGDNADFFMDGGSSVQTADEDRVRENLDGIGTEISEVDPDFLFLQEVDRNSDRSYHIDELSTLTGDFNYDAFAYNFKVRFIPYPMPPIGQVESGIATASDHELTSATRIALPCPFDWPVRTANLKRCLLVSRTPVLDADGNDTGRELVSVNLHLEAYDSGEGKAAQTEMLRQVLQDEADKGNYVIAGGDFNQVFSGTDASSYPTYDGMWKCGSIDESEFSDEWSFLMDTSAPTCRSLDRPYAGADDDGFQFYMIDGFIVSSNVRVDSVQTLDLGFEDTDHNPVVLEVTLL